MSCIADSGEDLASAGDENTVRNATQQLSIPRLARAAPKPTLKQKTVEEVAKAAAQYYKILYTKRAANKVSTASRNLKSVYSVCLSAHLLMQHAETKEQELCGRSAGSQNW